MKKNVLTFVLAIAMGFVAGSMKAQACTCENMLPQLGTGTSDVASPTNNTVSMAFWDDECYVLYINRWRMYVKRSTPEETWAPTHVSTDGTQPINFYPDKTTNPYPYEAQLVVFQGNLYAVFSESDGDGTTDGQGHKIVHVSRYDKAIDDWTFVDQAQTPPPPAGYERTGLGYPFYPGPDVWHWTYRTYNGVVATNCALYVAMNPGQVVIWKYDGTSWTILPTTGLPTPTQGLIAATIGLGHHQGSLVLAYQYYRASTGEKSLVVAKFDATTLSWSNISGWLNVGTDVNAHPALLAQYAGGLYAAWRETTLGQTEPSRLYVKRYDGGTTWTLLGSGAVHTSYPVLVANPLILCDYLLGDSLGAPTAPGLTLVSWHDSRLYVDRFNGTAWDTIATTAEANVWNPFSDYTIAPTTAATSRWDAATSTYKYYFAWHVLPADETARHVLAARLP